MRARDISKRLDEQLPKFFKTLPRTPYGVAPVPDAIAPKYTGGRYIPTSPKSTNPGYYWVNHIQLIQPTIICSSCAYSTRSGSRSPLTNGFKFRAAQ